MILTSAQSVVVLLLLDTPLQSVQSTFLPTIMFPLILRSSAPPRCGFQVPEVSVARLPDQQPASVSQPEV